MSDSSVSALGPASVVYFDGALRPAGDAMFSAADHGVLFGLGFFETFRTRGGHPHQLERHWQRLLEACAEADIAVPLHFLARDRARLMDAIAGLLRAHGQPDAVFRYTLTAGVPGRTGDGECYDWPVELLSLRALPPSAPTEGVALRVLSRRHEGGGRARPKRLNHANALLGARELTRRGAAPADEGLFLDANGFVVETTRQAIGWVRGGALGFAAPELGPIASTGLAWAREQVAVAMPERLPLAGLIEADAVFVVNGVRGITPVSELWDETDRMLLARFPSAGHPRVIELARRWSEALQMTARGPEELRSTPP